MTLFICRHFNTLTYIIISASISAEGFLAILDYMYMVFICVFI